jgi:hypothetical protein
LVPTVNTIQDDSEQVAAKTLQVRNSAHDELSGSVRSSRYKNHRIDGNAHLQSFRAAEKRRRVNEN